MSQYFVAVILCDAVYFLCRDFNCLLQAGYFCWHTKHDMSTFDYINTHVHLNAINSVKVHAKYETRKSNHLPTWAAG